MSTKPRYRIGVDIGGTFTDVVMMASDGTITTRKVPSTPDDYSRGIADCVVALLDELAIAPNQVDAVVHATTVATNTILEYKGAATGLITTRGFRDVLEMRRLRIPVLYDLQYRKPAPLVPRRHRFEVTERMSPRGEVWKPLLEEDARQAAAALAQAGVEAVAICLLHAYANPAHERRVAEILRETMGDATFITCSCDILPEIREYERTSTTVVNAYIGPVVRHYMTTLVRRLGAAGLECPIQIMHSAGGVMSLEAATRKPAYIVESGPAAGVIACARMASAVRQPNVISFDMGGTTTKTALVENGAPTKTAEYEVGAGINLSSKLVKGGGHPIKLPFIDVSEIGAGGGSIVSVGEDGRVTVGPQSAGAAPGPICYGFGGEQPTLTDALVTLGYINPDYLVGGRLPLKSDQARAEFERLVARPLSKPAIEAAHGVLTLAVASMTRAVKAVSTYRGRDPREFTLFAFGGNGPVVAAEIARALRMRRVLVPPAPGVFSALGLLFSDVEHEYVQTVLGRWEDVTPERLDQAYRALEAEALAAMAADGYGRERVRLCRLADMRYAGQAYELTVPVPLGAPDLGSMVRAFAAEHERTYGHGSVDDPADVVNVKVIASVPSGGMPEQGLAPDDKGHWTAPPATARGTYFGTGHGLIDVPVMRRDALSAGRLTGPLIVEEYDATTVVPPGCSAALDPVGNIDILLEDRA